MPAHKPPKPRAVLDTNVLLRVFLSPLGTTAQLLSPARRQHYQLVTSQPLLAELATTMTYPQVQRLAPWSHADITAIIRALRRYAYVCKGLYDVDLVPTDLDDNKVVAAALEGRADYIVTDDRRDLLPLKAIRLAGHKVIQIVRPTAFLRDVLPAI